MKIHCCQSRSSVLPVPLLILVDVCFRTWPSPMMGPPSWSCWRWSTRQPRFSVNWQSCRIRRLEMAQHQWWDVSYFRWVSIIYKFFLLGCVSVCSCANRTQKLSVSGCFHMSDRTLDSIDWISEKGLCCRNHSCVCFCVCACRWSLPLSCWRVQMSSSSRRFTPPPSSVDTDWPASKSHFLCLIVEAWFSRMFALIYVCCGL